MIIAVPLPNMLTKLCISSLAHSSEIHRSLQNCGCLWNLLYVTPLLLSICKWL